MTLYRADGVVEKVQNLTKLNTCGRPLSIGIRAVMFGRARYDARMKNAAETVLMIDPSTTALGWAVFRVAAKRGQYVASGVFKPTRGDEDKDWVPRIDQVVKEMGTLYRRYAPDRVVIELPDTYMSGRGAMAAGSGAIMKLMGCVMAIRQYFLGGTGAEVMLVPVRKWKGTVPKRITQKRIDRAWRGSIEWDDHNEADAVGIGDWYIRKHLRYMPRVRRAAD